MAPPTTDEENGTLHILHKSNNQSTSVKETGRGLSGKRKKRFYWCCGISCVLLVLLLIILIVLAVTLLKPKDPKISIDSVQLDAFDLALNLISPKLTLVLNMGVSVYNPNRASFKFSNSTSRILYHEDQVGEAKIPAGKIGSRGTAKLQTKVSIQALEIIVNSNLPKDVANGSIPISTKTVVSGRVYILNIFRRHATSTSVCNVTISVSSRNVQDFKCSQKTKL